MAEYTVFGLALQMEGMRNAQSLAKQFHARAKRTGSAEDELEGNRIQVIADKLEAMADETLRDIGSNKSTGDRVLIDMNTYQSIIDNENNLIQACKDAMTMIDEMALYRASNAQQDLLYKITETLKRGLKSSDQGAAGV